MPIPVNEWRESYSEPPDKADLVFLGWLDGEHFKPATNDGFWYLFAECGYDWKPVWGKK